MQHKCWQSCPNEHSGDSVGIGPTNGTVVVEELGKDVTFSEFVGVDGSVVGATCMLEEYVGRLGQDHSNLTWSQNYEMKRLVEFP